MPHSRSSKPQITQQELFDAFENYEDVLYWRHDRSFMVFAGDPAGGALNDKGYLVIRYGSRLYRTHQLIFLWHHGYIPKLIDHINGVRHDNRIENLRDASRAENNRNTYRHRTGKLRGTRRTRYNTWEAYVGVGGSRNKHLGTFPTEQAAHEAVLAYEMQA